MDLIDRKAAIDIVSGYAKQLNGYIGSPNDSEVYAYARGLILSIERNINAVPSAQPEPQWIPCSERLPEIGVNVLTVWTYEEFEPDIVVAYLKEWKGELYFDDIFGERDHALEDVPAWMPLPEPWRGEEHERG